MTAELKTVSVVKGGQPILQNASLHCIAGELTAFCGPNGAGKTTALSVLTAALSPDTGAAVLEGEDLGAIDELSLARRRAVVSQSSQLSFPFQVHEVVAMGRAPHHGLSTPMRDAEVVYDAICAMDLLHLAERNYLTLSGGERQRANIARALAQIWDPPTEGGARWLFLDEPTAALDLKYQIALMKRLDELANAGWGIVAVLHDLQLVKDYASQIVLFKAGQVVGQGKANDILSPERVRDVFDLSEPYQLA
ncbi:MAG: ATP-binding cassette domain-containing protein [Pseudomonadota bacterium]